jgi:hypothetical protein
MRTKIAAGATGGLIGGLALAAVMALTPAPAGSVSMLGFTAHLVRSVHPAVGWLVCAVYGALIGAWFGRLLHAQVLDAGPAMLWGGVYGLGWWIVAGLVLIPAALARWPLSIAAVDQVRAVALPLLIGHLVYGVILGLAWSRITHRPSTQRHSSQATVVGRRAA